MSSRFRVIVSATLLLSFLAVFANFSAKSFASYSLKRTGAALFSRFGGDLDEFYSKHRPICNDCLCENQYVNRLLTNNIDRFDESESTLAPTVQEDWIVLWTEGLSSLSYVWSMEHVDVGIAAYVLVDTTGKAQGVTLNHNDSIVNFVDESGSIYKVSIDGSDLTEVIDYCTVLDIDQEQCQGYGLDNWDYTSRLYWVDAKIEAILSCNYDGSDLQIMVAQVADCYGISIDKKGGYIYFTSSGRLYFSNYRDTGLVLSQVSLFINPTSYSITNVGVDSESRYVYWTGNDAIYRAAISESSIIETVYSGFTDINSVSLDWEQNLLFFSDKSGIQMGSLDGSKAVTTVAALYNTTFVYIRYETTPTPAPTAIPTSKPSVYPTAAPTSIPTTTPTSIPTTVPSQTPSSVPTSRPTAYPTPMPTQIPSSLPSHIPSSLPTSIPTSFPTSTPTTKPSMIPTPHPTAIPSTCPTSTPTEVPTIFPTSLPTSMPTSSPTSFPTAIPTSNPTSVCQWYYGHCGLCECDL